MTIILGLDVSTSCTGMCVVDSSIAPDDKGSHIILLDRIEFTHCKTFWDKADNVQRVLGNLVTELLARGPVHGLDPVENYAPGQGRIERVVVEEPLMGFRQGMSSAQTISQLMRFNGIVSYIARNIYQCEPEYVGSAHARKLCGIKLQKTSVAGPQKEQVFSHMSQHDLKHVKWPLTKTGKVVPWSRDACDAYVIARAAAIAGTELQVAKPKKSKKNS